jgi:DNA polymerase-3 subunit gamma/tau
MEYLVTARKWRPQVFDDVVGQEHITQTLKNAINNNRIAHAYLFTGPRGVGKTTTARIFSKALNCKNQKNAEPCNKCDICNEIQNGQSLDFIEIDGASNRGIDEVRTLRESVKYAPTHGKYKIYIIDEVHMLTKESFNAFLKTLEEPPEHIIFIFATTDAHKVPLTIISRCQRFDFRRIQMATIKDTIAKIAKAEKITIDDKTLTIIAKKADGALRDAESYFDQVVSFCGNKIDPETVAQMLNLIDDEIYFDISEAILSKNFADVFNVTNKIYENGWDFLDFTEGLIEHFRNIMTVVLTEKTSLTETADIYHSRYQEYMDRFSKGDLLRILNYLSKVQQELRFSSNQKLKIEIALSHLIGFEKSSTLSDIISEINSRSEIEKKNLHNEPIAPTNLKVTYSDSKSVGSKPVVTKPVDPIISYPLKNRKPVKQELNEVSTSELRFETVSDKWQYFLDEISKDRGLTLSPALNSLKLLSLSGNKLSVSSKIKDSRKTIELNKGYLENKSKTVFGKRLNFLFSTDNIKGKMDDLDPKNLESEKVQKKSTAKGDSLEDFIVKELKGVQIK